MKFGIGLAAVHPAVLGDVAVEADKLGFDSAWLPEHLVFPMDMSGTPLQNDDHPPVPPTTPTFDVFGQLCYLAGRTKNIKLGTNVYLLGLRHPFIAARAIATLDYLSSGRALVGIGSGWLRQEWQATGLDPKTRGKRLDEALAICKRLWTEEIIEHQGQFYEFEQVAFEPKPIQKPYPPIYVGGFSEAALIRCAKDSNGWIGLSFDVNNVAEPIQRLKSLLEDFGRKDDPFEFIMPGIVSSKDEIKRWEDAGVTQLIASPWTRTREAIDGVKRYADLVLES